MLGLRQSTQLLVPGWLHVCLEKKKKKACADLSKKLNNLNTKPSGIAARQLPPF